MTPAAFQPANLDPAARRYHGADGAAYHEGKRRVDPRALPWVQRLRAEKFKPWVRTADAVFELGVGAGWNLALLPCRRRLGCDVSPALRPGLEALGIEYFERFQEIPAGIADIAICHHALEHFLSPVDALAELARVLRPEGHLILHVPWEVERRFARYRPDDPNRHLYHWNVQNLGNLASILNWRIVSIRMRRYGYDRAAARIAVRARLGESGFRLLRRAMVFLRPLREVELVAQPPPPA